MVNTVAHWYFQRWLIGCVTKFLSHSFVRLFSFTALRCFNDCGNLVKCLFIYIRGVARFCHFSLTWLYYTNIRIFQFSTSLEKLPDHHNLPLFDDMLHFWYQSRVSLFLLLGYFVSIKTISFDIRLI